MVKPVLMVASNDRDYYLRDLVLVYMKRDKYEIYEGQIMKIEENTFTIFEYAPKQNRRKSMVTFNYEDVDKIEGVD